MKRILVIDESEVVRETLALILGREFAVLKRPLVSRGFPLADAREDVDLLIFGVTPQLGAETAGLLRFAAKLPFAVLFLVESKSIARTIEDKAEVGCLTKPFNPYELHEKVGQLLARRSVFSEVSRQDEPETFAQYLDFPHLSRSAAVLVRRFAATRLPMLLTGELGCGQYRVAAGICSVDIGAPPVTIYGPEVSEEYLDQVSARLSLQASFKEFPSTVVIQDLHNTPHAAQSLLLNFLREGGGKADDVRYLATANTDLLKKVYHGEFLEPLYYRLATLTLKLAPLRERQDDIPFMAEWIAAGYAKKLGLSGPRLSQSARQRLINYLWFGNVSELETVIARTLAFHRKADINVEDLIFDFSGDPPPGVHETFAEFVPGDARSAVEAGEPILEVYTGTAPSRSNGHAKTADLNAVIHELAHELKNPMVTIKTFAQLLGERYQDESFRNRFQEIVGNDIERMDDLLEMMLEFADFSSPRRSNVALIDKLRSVLAEIHGACAKRQIRFHWKERGGSREIEADESQLQYILKNILLATAAEAKLGSEIEIDISGDSTVVISYFREGARVASISHYLSEQSSPADESNFPLRVLLAKHLLERNGGQFTMSQSNGGKETLKLEFPDHRATQ
jgi:two-component system, NtrC family, response regulator PilR